MERVVRIFRSFEDAERADEEYYASLTPEERLDLQLELIERWRSSFGEAADRFERVHRFVELSSRVEYVLVGGHSVAFYDRKARGLSPV